MLYSPPPVEPTKGTGNDPTIDQRSGRVARNGVPAAVLISPEDLQVLEDTLELLADQSALAEISSARRQITTGDVVGADELRAKYLSK